VAKLIERPLAEHHSGFESRHLSNIIKKATLAKEWPRLYSPPKNIQKGQNKKVFIEVIYIQLNRVEYVINRCHASLFCAILSLTQLSF
jgi:hypothetical protein